MILIRYVFILFFILFGLTACSNKKVDNTNVNSQKTNDFKEEKILKQEKTSKQITNNILLTKFDKELIKMAIKKDINLCNNLDSSKIDFCREIVKKEKDYLNKLFCDKLVYLKEDCFDKKYFIERKCDLIKNDYQKRQCLFQKEYDQAIKNKDKTFCNKLPRIKKQECFKKILTN